jgi:hypothetical protein
MNVVLESVTYQRETCMLDSPEGVCPGQARFEYPATFVFLTPASGRCPETSGSATAAIPPPQHGYARPEPVPEINVAQPDVSEGSTTTAARNAPRHARVRTAGQQPRLQVDASSLRRASLSDGLGVPRNRSACSCVSGVAVAARPPPHTVLAGMALPVGVLTAQPLPSAAPRTGKSSSRLESGGELHVSWRQTVNVGAGREPHSSPHTALNATHAAHSPAHRWWWARHAGRFSAALRVRLLLVGGWGTAAAAAGAPRGRGHSEASGQRLVVVRQRRWYSEVEIALNDSAHRDRARERATPIHRLGCLGQILRQSFGVETFSCGNKIQIQGN